MAAGDTVALVYELSRENNDDFKRESTPQVANKLHLATDSHKYRME
jgi:hypothetical protein